ncbi:unnamed protein product [Euphydryas editha]|uniref:Uncharacterized protein n=1 Tax=Euphydryas editha TaxID=104508 RepID=A0AAU9UTD8_EUPED|nr:unnamed protein product [Euphydryas editha]
MLQVGLVLFTIGVFSESWAGSLEHGNLLERIKRSPYYYDPESLPYQQRYWPQPPPLPPYWYHHNYEPGHSFDRPTHSFPGPRTSFPGPGPSFPESELSWPHRQKLTDGQNDSFENPCKSCKGKNAAISNSESVNGDSISIAISRSNSNT